MTLESNLGCPVERCPGQLRGDPMPGHPEIVVLHCPECRYEAGLAIVHQSENAVSVELQASRYGLSANVLPAAAKLRLTLESIP